MRISTFTMFQNATNQLGTLQSGMARTQMQLATQRRMLTAADDPIASARALEVTQSQAMNEQYATNRTNARGTLSQVEQTLDGTTSLLQDVQDLVVKAGNGALSASDRGMLATELEGRLNDLFGMANTSDSAGGYLFSGYKSTTVPFTQTATGATYHGDQGQRALQVGSARQVPVSDSGSAIFENNLTGNGRFQTLPAAGNTGSGVISSGSVVDNAQFTGHDYAIAFAASGAPAVTSYTVTDNSTTPGTVVQNAVPYVSGKQIAFGGMAFDIAGTPAAGDQFTVKPSEKQSVFATVTKLIDLVRQPAGGAAAHAALANGLAEAGDNLKLALDNVLTVRASIGSRLKEIDNLDSIGDDLDVQYKATLSDLQDLDVVKAISMFTQQQQTLEAAQKSFKSISGLSLFNYIG
ncbi:MAG TPA: flagellar hook-associated protein FlgL [Telluria sp.]